MYGVSVYQSMYPEGEYYGDIRTDNLSYSDDDAKSLGDLLANQGWTVQERIKGDIVSGGETSYLPTKAQLISDITALSSLITSDSTVLVYFSGHGDTQNGITYIVPYLGVADSTSPVEDLSKCISPDDLSSMLSILPTQNIIIIFDTCYSGGFVNPGSAIDASPQSYTMQSFSAFSTALSNFGSLLSANASASGQKSPIVLSAAGSEESSYDGTSAMQHGVFTYYLLQAATNAGSGGFVTTTQAYAYTSAAIISHWDAAYSYDSFLPHLSGGVRDLVLFEN